MGKPMTDEQLAKAERHLAAYVAAMDDPYGWGKEAAADRDAAAHALATDAARLLAEVGRLRSALAPESR